MVVWKGFFALALCFGSVAEQLITTEEVWMKESLPLEEWESDFASAKKEALEKNTPILIAFLGPDWCPFSDQLEEEVLADPTFFKKLQQQLVLFKVDLPEHLEEGSFESELKERYQLDQCPALALVKPDGELIAKLGRLPLDASAFSKAIEELLCDYDLLASFSEEELSTKELKDLYVKAGQFADNALKSSLLKKGLKEDKTPYFLAEEYGQLLAAGNQKSFRLRRLRSKIAKRDPKNEQGFQRKLALMDFEALASLKKPASAEKVVKPLVRYLKQFGAADLENAWQIELKISQYLFGQDQVEEALKHARTSLTLAPESQQKEIAQSIEYLETKIE